MTHNDQSRPPTNEKTPFTTRRAILAIAAVFLLGAVFYAGRTTSATPSTAASAPTASPTVVPKPTIIAGAGILRRVQALSRLETAMYSIETVVRSEEKGVQVMFLTVGGKKLLQIVQGSVIAGIDLDKLKASDINVSADNQTVTVQLPPAEIFIASLDKSELVDYEGLPFSSPSPGLLEQANQKGREKIQEIACRDKILDMATRQGQASIVNLLAALGVDGVNFVVQPAPVPTCAIEVTVQPTVTP